MATNLAFLFKRRAARWLPRPILVRHPLGSAVGLFCSRGSWSAGSWRSWPWGRRQLLPRAEGLLLGAACLTFALSATVSHAAAVVVLVGAVVLLTLGETGHSAAEAWLAVALTQGRAAGTVVGLLKTTMSLQQALGPLLVVLLLTVGGRAGWVVLAGLLVAAALLSRRLAVGDLGVARAADPVEVR